MFIIISSQRYDVCVQTPTRKCAVIATCRPTPAAHLINNFVILTFDLLTSSSSSARLMHNEGHTYVTDHSHALAMAGVDMKEGTRL